INDGSLIFEQGLGHIQDVTYSGEISGTGDVIYRLGATLTLTGENSYTGRTVVRGGDSGDPSGVLSVSSSSNLGGDTNELLLDDAVLEVTGTQFNHTARNITLSGLSGFAIDESDNTFEISGNIDTKGEESNVLT